METIRGNPRKPGAVRGIRGKSGDNPGGIRGQTSGVEIALGLSEPVQTADYDGRTLKPIR